MNYKQLKATGNSVSNYNYEYVENTNERTFASTYYFLIDTAFYLITIIGLFTYKEAGAFINFFKRPYLSKQTSYAL